MRGRQDTGELSAKLEAFLEEVREKLRAKRYAYRTEQTYLEWVRRFLIFANPKSRADLCPEELDVYLNYLVLVRRVSASTQNQALNAVQFLFRDVLERGVRVNECVRLRVKDLDFDQGLIVVREGKGWKDRKGLTAKERRNTRV